MPWREAQGGDGRALAEIVRAQADKVAAMLVHLLGPRGDLEDLVQTVFLELCKALPSFRGDSPLSTFIGGITVHVARRARRPSAWMRFRRDEAEGEHVASDAPSPESAAISTEQVKRTRRALERIGAKKREAFILWALWGLEIEQVATMIGASVSATRSRIFHAQKELQHLASRDPYLNDLALGKRTQQRPGNG